MKVHKDIDRCLSIAAQYHRLFDNDSNNEVYEFYYRKDKLIKEISSIEPYQGCFVRIGECRKHSEKIGFFYDNYQNVSSDKERCMERTDDYQKWCKNEMSSMIQTKYYMNGKLLLTEQ